MTPCLAGNGHAGFPAMTAHQRHSLTSRQLADALGVSESSVKRWVDDGAIAAHRTAGGHRRITLSAAVQFIRKHRVEVARPGLLQLPSKPAVGGVDASAVQSLKDALLRDEVAEVSAILIGRYLGGADIAGLADGLIRPVLHEIGELWLNDGEGILIEHRAVASCIEVLSELAAWIPDVPDTAPAAVCAAGPDDPYLLPPLLASLVLRERGARARNIGPLTPRETLLRAVDRYGAAICSLSVSVKQEPRSNAWLEFASAIAARGAQLVIGGRCVESTPPTLRQHAHVCGSMTELGAYATGLIHAAGKRRTVQRPRSAARD
jgi:excisionase family DNA binding protein